MEEYSIVVSKAVGEDVDIVLAGRFNSMAEIVAALGVKPQAPAVKKATPKKAAPKKAPVKKTVPKKAPVKKVAKKVAPKRKKK